MLDKPDDADGGGKPDGQAGANPDGADQGVSGGEGTDKPTDDQDGGDSTEGMEPDDSPAQDAADNSDDPDMDSLEGQMPPEDPDAASLDGTEPPADDQDGDQAEPDATSNADDSAADGDKPADQDAQTQNNPEQEPAAAADADKPDGDTDGQRNAGKQQPRDVGESLGDKNNDGQNDPEPVTNNPITAAARDYLETPKAERHAGSALGRIENAYHAGERIGSDFDSYKDLSRGQQKSYKEHKDMVAGMKSFQKEMDKDDGQQ